jgi:hypothetical protein
VLSTIKPGESMKKALLPLVAVLLCGLVPPPNPGVDEKVPWGRAKTYTHVEELEGLEAEEPENATERRIEDFLELMGGAARRIDVHSNPEAGQFWEMQTNTDIALRWQVGAVAEDLALIEQLSHCEATWDSFSVVEAYLVDLTKSENEPNVIRAWIGPRGGEAREVQLVAEDAEDDGYVEFDIEYRGLELAGREWAGIWTIAEDEQFTYMEWRATDGWFDGVIKWEMLAPGGAKNEARLHAFGRGATPLLKYPADAMQRPKSAD